MTMNRMIVTLVSRGRAFLQAGSPPALVPARVPACRCGGCCRCGGMVPALLLRKIEQECEFYRRVM